MNTPNNGSPSVSVFEQYWRYATHLRNWFIGYGVGAILLVAQTEGAFESIPQEKRRSIILFLVFGLLSQVILAFLNKIAHYYDYTAEKSIERGAEPGCWGQFWTQVSNQFWIDLIADIVTLVLFAIASIKISGYL